MDSGVVGPTGHVHMERVSREIYNNWTNSVLQQQNENYRYIVPNFISDSFISIDTKLYLLTLQFHTGPQNFLNFQEIMVKDMVI